MCWDQLKTLSDDGLTLAPHTRTHPLMHRISIEQARDEMRAARDDICTHIGHTVPAFAYPGGAYNRSVVAMLAEEGYELAFTTCRGANRVATSDPLQLRRINIGRRTTPDLLATQLLLSPPVINRLSPQQVVA